MTTIPPGVKGWNLKPIAALPAKDSRGKVNIQPQKFDELIDKQGCRVKVYRTTYCPNVKSIDGAEHEINCALCNGSQFIDCFPLDTWAFFQNQKLTKGVQPEGLYDGNTVMATFQQGVDLQYFTLVELLDFTEPFIERIKKQEGNLDVLRYKATRVNFLVDKKGRHYYEGSDFALDVNGNIFWCADKNPPPKGMIYSIHYETLIRFRAVRAEHTSRFAQTSSQGVTALIKMNEQWMLQKEYLVVRKDIDGNVIKPNKIRDSDEE